MTEQTIRVLAKELAAKWYEENIIARQKGQKLEVRDPITGHLLRSYEPDLFLKTFPRLRDYWAGRRHGRIERKIEAGVQVTWHVDDGSITSAVPGWLHHYQLARQQLVFMLGLPDEVVTPHSKIAIYLALLEDREKQLRHEALGNASPYQDPGIPQAITTLH